MRNWLAKSTSKIKKSTPINKNPICFDKITSDAKGNNAYNHTDSVAETIDCRKEPKECIR